MDPCEWTFYPADQEGHPGGTHAYGYCPKCSGHIDAILLAGEEKAYATCGCGITVSVTRPRSAPPTGTE